MRAMSVACSLLYAAVLTMLVFFAAHAFDGESGPAGAEGISRLHAPDSAYSRPGRDWDRTARDIRKNADGPRDLTLPVRDGPPSQPVWPTEPVYHSPTPPESVP